MDDETERVLANQSKTIAEIQELSERIRSLVKSISETLEFKAPANSVICLETARRKAEERRGK
jgi:hypothetical protein